MKLYFGILLLMLIPAILYCQNSNGYEVGDTIPEFKIQILKGGNYDTLKSASLKGKSIIFDFWSTDCPSCIIGMEHMLNLQQKFNDSIVVVVVTQNSKSEIDSLWKLYDKLSNGRKLKSIADQLHFATENREFYDWFPHIGNPIHVWVSSNRVLRAIAYAESTTNDNVEKFINGQEVEFAHQKILPIDQLNPISWAQQKGMIIDTNADFVSLLLDRIETGRSYYSPILRIDSISSLTCVFSVINWPLEDLYRFGYGIYNNKSVPIIKETRKKELFTSPSNSKENWKWQKSNTFCYYLKVPFFKSIDFHDLFIAYLDRHFLLTTLIESRPHKVWVLRKKFNNYKADSEMGESSTITFAKDGKNYRQFVNSKYDAIMHYIEVVLQSQANPLPFINGTLDKKRITLTLPFNLDPSLISIEELSSMLEKQGYQLSKETKMVRSLVVKDRVSPLDSKFQDSKITTGRE